MLIYLLIYILFYEFVLSNTKKKEFSWCTNQRDVGILHGQRCIPLVEVVHMEKKEATITNLKYYGVRGICFHFSDGTLVRSYLLHSSYKNLTSSDAFNSFNSHASRIGMECGILSRKNGSEHAQVIRNQTRSFYSMNPSFSILMVILQDRTNCQLAQNARG